MEKKTEFPNRAIVANMGFNEAIVFENPDYDAAIIGVDSIGRVIYDLEKMTECLHEEGMSYEDALDFIGYNTVRSLPYMGPKAPIVMRSVDDGDDVPEISSVIGFDSDDRPVYDMYRKMDADGCDASVAEEKIRSIHQGDENAYILLTRHIKDR